MTRSTPSSRQTRRSGGQPTRLPLLPLVGGVVAVVLIGVIGFAVYNTIQDRNIRTAPIEGVQTYSVQRDHVTTAVNQDLGYDQIPPVGGPHDANWQNCGIYDQPIFSKHAVHSLEHGAVWITYQPGLAAADIAKLKGLVTGRDYALLSPYPDLPSPVVASAWGVQLKLESADDPRLSNFIRKYAQGPQTPEPGAACFNGTSVVKAQ
jgi:hypothetical protein